MLWLAAPRGTGWGTARQPSHPGQASGNTRPTCWSWEADDLRKGPTAHYDKSTGPFFDAEHHRELMGKICAALAKLTAGEKPGRRCR